MLWRYNIFVYKQKTAYEMRISDWSSDVCSSDLHSALSDLRPQPAAVFLRPEAVYPRLLRGLAAREYRDGDRCRYDDRFLQHHPVRAASEPEIGRPSCRESGCQDV